MRTYANNHRYPWTPSHDRQPAIQAPTGITFVGYENPPGVPTDQRVQNFLESDRAGWYNLVNLTAHDHGGHFIPWEIPTSGSTTCDEPSVAADSADRTDLAHRGRAEPGVGGGLPVRCDHRRAAQQDRLEWWTSTPAPAQGGLLARASTADPRSTQPTASRCVRGDPRCSAATTVPSGCAALAHWAAWRAGLALIPSGPAVAQRLQRLLQRPPTRPVPQPQPMLVPDPSPRGALQLQGRVHPPRRHAALADHPSAGYAAACTHREPTLTSPAASGGGRVAGASKPSAGVVVMASSSSATAGASQQAVDISEVAPVGRDRCDHAHPGAGADYHLTITGRSDWSVTSRKLGRALTPANARRRALHRSRPD